MKKYPEHNPEQTNSEYDDPSNVIDIFLYN